MDSVSEHAPPASISNLTTRHHAGPASHPAGRESSGARAINLTRGEDVPSISNALENARLFFALANGIFQADAGKFMMAFTTRFDYGKISCCTNFES